MAKKYSEEVAALLERREETLKEVAEIRDVERLQAFWDRHPRLNVLQVFDICGEQPELAYGLIRATIKIAEERRDDKIDLMVQIFGIQKRDIEASIRGVTQASRRIDIGERELKTEIKHLYSYFQRFLERKLNAGRNTRDGGKTWLVYGDEDIAEATEALTSENRLVCARTLMMWLERRKGYIALEA